MTRISKKWKGLRFRKQKGLVLFLTAGDPDLRTTKKLIPLLEREGADILELGVPFSDPMADGPVIQRASERALAKGVTLKKILAAVREARERSQIPILLMGYYNPILAFGPGRYAREAARAGVDGTLVVDLPPEESEELDRELKKVGVDLIYLLTPTSGPDRIRRVCRKARGFIYFVSITGVTGARLRSEGEIKRKIFEIKRHTDLPVVVGFGISNPAQASRISRLADGVVIGSALVSLIHRYASSERLPQEACQFVRALKRSL